ncbi:HK97 family phage prohead protease [Mesorhizobium dulcispinae]|uniref:HK97 family phage prohead protease n=1 Tax=Mesorhizobium dulcispinae TaxID=3072316 RepID=UPI002A23BE36|nr:HK97 family phage prohead protease [Mesorhizobium sp. VK23D]MDX8521305.1 HK97 family phage prohead protease [Mesorhizobium sp. VK23D]
MSDNVISGYCVRFGDITTIGSDFRERIAPGAFTDSLRDRDIVMLLNHDSGRVLGRTSAGSLKLVQDRIGLYFSLDVDPTTPEGQTALGTVRRRDVKGCSFAGRFLEEEWEDGGNLLPLRTVTKVELWEATLTGFPAYETTSAVLARSADAPANASAARRRVIEKMERDHRLRGIR